MNNNSLHGHTIESPDLGDTMPDFNEELRFHVPLFVPEDIFHPDDISTKKFEISGIIEPTTLYSGTDEEVIGHNLESLDLGDTMPDLEKANNHSVSRIRLK